MAATQSKSEADKIYIAFHAVNLRTRMDPPLPENSFGNITRVAISELSMDTEEGFSGIVNQVRDSVRRVNTDFVKKLQNSDDHWNFMKDLAARIAKGAVVPFDFTSLCKFPLYDIDFGWGKPVWVSSVSFEAKNFVALFDTKSGDGIEAWIHLKEEDMAKFERDEELLPYVSPTTWPNAKSYVL